MATLGSFWRRVGRLFRGDGNVSDDGGAPLSRSTPQSPGELASAPGGGWSTLRRQPSRRELGERYQRVLELMDAMHTHFEKQDERAGQLTASVQQVAGALNELIGAQQAQGASLRTVADRVVAVSTHAAALSETLSELPGSLHAQAEAVQSLGRRLEIAQEADHRVANSLGDLGHAVDTLRTASTSQVEALRQLHAREQEQREALGSLVRDQSRRFLIIIIVAAILAICALAAMGITLAMVLRA
jgi:chromosome segregation ATPase